MNSTFIFLFTVFCILSSIKTISSQILTNNSINNGLKCYPMNPCLNGGECVSSSHPSHCRCLSSFVGSKCQHSNPCHPSNRCLNGGTCLVQTTSHNPQFRCLCPIGFSASLCEIQLPSICDSNPCQNGAKCQLRSSIDQFICQCVSGWTGDKCHLRDNCASNPCKNGARCESGSAGFSCTCAKGYKGLQCTQDIDECMEVNTCHNNGLCMNTMGSFKCNCEKGWTGHACEHRYIPCEHDKCLNGGHCVPNYHSLTHSCQCGQGFTGRNCEQNVDDCGGNLCQNGGTCVDAINTYTCKCSDQWSGPYCSRDVDECSIRPHVCQNGATCVNSLGSYSCICVNGWTGSTCGDNIDDCAQAACFNGATCHDRVGSFYCQCPTGKTGLLCHLDDACASNPCHLGAICDTSPIDGTYMCSCPLGFKGIDCTLDIDECRESGSPCEHGGTCVNTPGSFRCDCALGFAGPRCEVNINECDSNPCLNDGTCLDERGSYRCVCMPGYSGLHCEEDVDECESNPCLNNALCTDLINGFRCLCPLGFEGNKCHLNLDDCFSSPCLNGGECRDQIGSYTCECPSGFTGFTCDINVNDCESSPCHHGKCIDAVNSFKCACSPGFTGLLCQSQLNECLSNPCQFGGTCRDHINGYSCECPLGTTGSNCEYNVNECWSNPCRNSGTCHDLIGKYQCQCLPGYTGSHCEQDIDECASSPCANGGTCFDKANGYKCQCMRGFYGSRCLSDVDECASNPCLNGGTCEDDLNAYLCHCAKGYSGARCEKETDECVSAPCQNNGKCIDQHAKYECICPLGFSGKYCEQNVDDCARVTCLNGGTCLDGVNAFQCLCLSPFTGFYCESELNPFRDNPWKACPLAHHCYAHFADKTCQMECNSKECLFDGFDCRQTSIEMSNGCNELYDSYCARNYANGHCDYGCNNAECAWDGLDCEQKQHNDEQVVIRGALILSVDAPFSLLSAENEESRIALSSLLRELSTLIGSVVKLREIRANGSHSTQLVLNADNRRCGQQCFDSSREIASFLEVSKSRDPSSFDALLHSGFRITSIDATDGVGQGDDSPLSTPHGLTYVAVSVVVLLVGGALLGVLVTTSRKKVAKGITWFPEGFFSNQMTTQSARDRHQNNVSANAACGDYSRTRRRSTAVARTGRPDGQEMRQFKSRDDLIDEKSACAIYEEPMECRAWSHAHYEAYQQHAESMTPPLATPTIDAIGPNGMTPLMIASAFPHHVITIDNPDTCLPDNNAVHDLLINGANVSLQCERTCETSLHLAARHARADAAKRLLEGGADPNVTDATGRTPLHTAIASDARGVFEILLRNRSTNLNARTNDGTTPLVLAARLANEGMLDQLVMSECDLNACDDSGKSALHWASSVNNCDAVRVLLINGANRDAQNHREETPLFLAAREGAFQCAKILLENHANRDITDHMDRLPRDVALERMHTDIVALLDEFVPALPQQSTHSLVVNSNPISPQNQRQNTIPRNRKQNNSRVPPLPPPRNAIQLTTGQQTSHPSYELSPPLVSPPSRPPPTYEDCLKQRQLVWTGTTQQQTAPPRPPESYLTPSPDSPNTWMSSPSTSSPISAHDWLSLQTNGNTQTSDIQSNPRFQPTSTQTAVFI